MGDKIMIAIFEDLKRYIIKEIATTCACNKKTYTNAYILDTDADQKALEKVRDYLIENGFQVKIKAQTKILYQITISW